MTDRSIIWRRLDKPGHEAARLVSRGGGWELFGTAVFAHEGAACRLDYPVACDAAWRTVAARVSGWVGEEAVEIELSADPGGRWRLDGVERPEVEGCTDIDFGFSPSTNTLPIRRLRLGVGASHTIKAAWVRFPELTVVKAAQTYTRLDEFTYRYKSGTFEADLTVDDDGLVTAYADWRRTAYAAGPDATDPLDARD